VKTLSSSTWLRLFTIEAWIGKAGRDRNNIINVYYQLENGVYDIDYPLKRMFS
jgi:hypothetical protein